MPERNHPLVSLVSELIRSSIGDPWNLGSCKHDIVAKKSDITDNAAVQMKHCSIISKCFKGTRALGKFASSCTAELTTNAILI